MVGGLHCVGVEGLEVLPNVLCTAQWKNLLDGQVVPVRAKTSISFELDKADICISVPSIPISIFVEGWWRLAFALGLWQWW